MDVEMPAPWEMCGWTWETLRYQSFDGVGILEAPHCPRGGMSAEISCSPLATAQLAFGALCEVRGFGSLFESNKNDISHEVCVSSGCLDACWRMCVISLWHLDLSKDCCPVLWSKPSNHMFLFRIYAMEVFFRFVSFICAFNTKVPALHC